MKSDFIVASNSTYYNLVNLANNLALGSDGTSVIIQPQNASNKYQSWQMIYLSNYYFFIFNESANKYLDVNPANGQIILSPLITDSNTQIWQIFNNGTDNGNYSLLNLGVNKVIESNGQVAFLDTPSNNNSNQKWAFDCTNDDITVNFDISANLLGQTPFLLSIPGGGYISLGSQMQPNTYNLTATTDTATALTFQYNSGKQLTTQVSSQILQLDIYNKTPILTNTLISDCTPKLFLFNDSFSYLRTEGGLYLNQIDSFNFSYTSTQVQLGTRFDFVPLANFSSPGIESTRLLTGETLTTCQIAWATLLWQGTGGLILALGLGPAVLNGQVQTGLINLLSTNATLNRNIQTLANLLSNETNALIAVALVNQYLIVPLWATGLLWDVLSLLLPTLGWFTLAYILKKIIILAFAPEYIVAELLVNFAIWGVQLFLAAKNVSNCAAPILLDTKKQLSK